MAAGLYGDEAPAFSAAMDACLETLRECDLDLRSVWLDRDPEAVRHTAAAQPLLMAVQHAMAQELGAAGIVPDVMLGHSIGELVAATVAGVFDIKDALHLVAARSKPMGEMAGGAMLAVAAGPADLADMIEEPLALAAVNAPRQVVVSGPVDAIESLARRLSDEGTPTQLLRTSHGFHSPMMEAAVQRFESAFGATHLRPPRIPLISAATGVELTDEQARSPRFWARQIVEPVLFGAALDRLLDRGPHLMLEMAPGRTLTSLCRSIRRSCVATARSWPPPPGGPASPTNFVSSSPRSAPSTSKATTCAGRRARSGGCPCPGTPTSASVTGPTRARHRWRPRPRHPPSSGDRRRRSA